MNEKKLKTELIDEMKEKRLDDTIFQTKPINNRKKHANGYYYDIMR